MHIKSEKAKKQRHLKEISKANFKNKKQEISFS